MGSPSDKPTEMKRNRNNINDLAGWLNVAHPGKYMVFNFA
jgi:hypothetical protein